MSANSYAEPLAAVDSPLVVVGVGVRAVENALVRLHIADRSLDSADMNCLDSGRFQQSDTSNPHPPCGRFGLANTSNE